MADHLTEAHHEALMKKYRAEGRLVAERRTKCVLSVLGTIAWYTVWVWSALDYFSRDYATFNPKNVMMYAASLVILIIPFFLLRPQRVFERVWYGTVESIRTETEFRRRSRVSGDHVDAFLIMQMKDAADKQHKLKLRLRPGIRDYYVAGQAYSVLPDVRYPVRIEEPPLGTASDPVVFCPHCGSFEPYRYTKCFDCSRPLWNKRTARDLF